MSILGLNSGYTVKSRSIPRELLQAKGYIWPYIPPLVLIRIQYTRWVWCKRQKVNIKFKISMSLSEKVLFNWASVSSTPDSRPAHVFYPGVMMSCMWHVTLDMCHMTCDMWHTGGSEYCLNILGPLALMVWELSMMFWRYLNKRMCPPICLNSLHKYSVKWCVWCACRPTPTPLQTYHCRSYWVLYKAYIPCIVPPNKRIFTSYILYANGTILVDNKISFEMRTILTKYGHRQCLLPCLQCCQTGQQI